MKMIRILKNNLLFAHGNKILAIGVYGSAAIEKDGPYSDIELHVIIDQVIHLENADFVYDKFKIEISLNEKMHL